MRLVPARLRPAAGGVAVVALIALAALLVALAADVLRWDRTLRDEDVAYAAGAEAAWAPNTLLPAGVSRSLFNRSSFTPYFPKQRHSSTNISPAHPATAVHPTAKPNQELPP